MALVIGGLAVFEFAREERWVGGYDLIVKIDPNGEPPTSVLCLASSRNDAEFMVNSPDPELNAKVNVKPFQGEPIRVLARVSGRYSFFALCKTRTQDQYLAVIALWPDGRRVGRVVEIPDGRESREITVSLP